MVNPEPRKRRGPIASRLLAVDASVNSSLYEIGFKARQFWEGATIFSRRFRLKGWRRGIIEVLSEGFTLGAGGIVLMLALAIPAFRDTADDDWLTEVRSRRDLPRPLRQRDRPARHQAQRFHPARRVSRPSDQGDAGHRGPPLLSTISASTSLGTVARAGRPTRRPAACARAAPSITQQLAKNLFLTQRAHHRAQDQGSLPGDLAGSHV